MTRDKRRQLATLLHEWADHCTNNALTIYELQDDKGKVTPLVDRGASLRIADNYLASAGYALEVARLADPDVGVVVRLPVGRRKSRTLDVDERDGENMG